MQIQEEMFQNWGLLASQIQSQRKSVLLKNQEVVMLLSMQYIYPVFCMAVC